MARCAEAGLRHGASPAATRGMPGGTIRCPRQRSTNTEIPRMDTQRLILLFIFLTPREFFRDQPKAASIVMLPAQQGFLLDPGLLEGVAAPDQPGLATRLVRDRFKTNASVTRVEPVLEEGQLTGYIALTER